MCRYKVEKTGIVQSKDLFGISIVFDNVVEKTISDWQIKPVTLLTRIGGIIGVGKELLWVIVFICSSISLVLKYMQ